MAGPPPATLLARDAWRLGFGAIRAMPQLFGGTFALLLGFEAAFRWQHPAAMGWPSLGEVLLGFANDLATEVIIAGAMIAVHRSVLLGTAVDRPVWQLPPNYDRFLGWTLLLNLVMLPMAALPGLIGDGKSATAAGALVFVIAGAAAIAVLVRLGTLLPALAADMPEAGWRAAWAMSRGHAWRFVGVGVLTFLPLDVAAFFAGKLFSQMDGPGSFLLAAAFASGNLLLQGAVGAAMWSRLLQAYGAARLRPVAPW